MTADPHLYRIVDYHYGNEGCYPHHTTLITVLHLQIVKTTRCGVWVRKPDFLLRWVSNSSIKRYAWPTEAEAWESFKARKAKQLAIYQNKLAQATVAFELAKLPNTLKDLIKKNTPGGNTALELRWEADPPYPRSLNTQKMLDPGFRNTLHLY